MNAPAAKPDIDLCAACGRLFPRVYVKLCSECVLSEPNRFSLVRDFLVSNAGASIGEISDATGLSRGEVARFHGEGRLVSVDGERLPIGEAAACTCGGSGTRCAFCRNRLAQKFNALQQAPKLGELASNDAASGERVRYVRRAHRTD